MLPDSTWAFLWSRTQPHPELLALLAIPPGAALRGVPASEKAPARLDWRGGAGAGQEAAFHPAGWHLARGAQDVQQEPHLDGFPVLAIKPDALSTYGMRVAHSDEHLCTTEVAACVLEVAGELQAARRCSLVQSL